MKLKSLFSFIMLACGMIYSLAQSNDSPKYAHLTVESIEKAQRTAPDSIVKYDGNMDPIAILMIESPVRGLDFEGGGVFIDDSGKKYVDVKKRQNGTYLYTVGILQGYRSLTVKHNDYASTNIDFGNPTSPKELWRIKIIPVEAAKIETAQINEENKKYRVEVESDYFSDLYIDNVNEYRNKDSKTHIAYLTEGIHYISSNHPGGSPFERRINVKENSNNKVEVNYGSEVEATNAQNVSYTPHGNAPDARYNGDRSSGRTVVFDNMFGEYTLHAQSNGTMVSKDVTKTFKIGSRKHKTFRVDEMVPYTFVLYSGTNEQPIGMSLGWCKNFGLNYTMTIGAEEIDESYQMNFTIGPMFRVYRKLYFVLEGGAGSCKDEYDGLEWGFTASAKVMLRLRSFAIGVGYTKFFVDSSKSDQVNFSIGFAI